MNLLSRWGKAPERPPPQRDSMPDVHAAASKIMVHNARNDHYMRIINQIREESAVEERMRQDADAR